MTEGSSDGDSRYRLSAETPTITSTGQAPPEPGRFPALRTSSYARLLTDSSENMNTQKHVQSECSTSASAEDANGARDIREALRGQEFEEHDKIAARYLQITDGFGFWRSLAEDRNRECRPEHNERHHSSPARVRRMNSTLFPAHIPLRRDNGWKNEPDVPLAPSPPNQSVTLHAPGAPMLASRISSTATQSDQFRQPRSPNFQKPRERSRLSNSMEKF